MQIENSDSHRTIDSAHGDQRHEPQEAFTPAQKDLDARGTAAVRAETKTPPDGVQNPDNPRQRAVPPMLVTEQTTSQPVHERSPSSTAVDPVTRQYVSRSDERADVPFTVETSPDVPPKTPEAFKPKPSPFLEAMTGYVVFQVDKLAEPERHRQYARDAVARSRQKKRQQDPEGYKKEERERKRDWRARKKKEAESQHPQPQQE